MTLVNYATKYKMVNFCVISLSQAINYTTTENDRRITSW